MSRAGRVPGSIPITSQLVEIEHMERIRWWVALLSCVLARSVVLADDDFSWLVRGEGVDASQPSGEAEPEASLTVTPFGEVGSWRWAIYGGAAADVSNDAEHYNLHFSAEHFLAEYFSINLELGTLGIGDDGARLMGGVRWHHISNARIKGEDHNPGRDSIMVYVGMSFPW